MSFLQQLATIYVLPQEYVTPYPPDMALQYGTVFSNLHQPFVTTSCCNSSQKQCTNQKQ